MTTSGRPFLAVMAACTLVYSSPPWPTLFQQIWTSLWPLLKLSTTSFMLGYQPQTETCGAFGYTYLLEQPVSLGLVPVDFVEPPPVLQAARMLASATAVIAARSAFFFTVFPFIGVDFIVKGGAENRCCAEDIAVALWGILSLYNVVGKRCRNIMQRQSPPCQGAARNRYEPEMITRDARMTRARRCGNRQNTRAAESNGHPARSVPAGSRRPPARSRRGPDRWWKASAACTGSHRCHRSRSPRHPLESGCPPPASHAWHPGRSRR